LIVMTKSHTHKRGLCSCRLLRSE